MQIETFGERLRRLRTERKLHQSQFGDMFNLSPSAIGAYERNEREPTYRHLVEFANFYKVSVDFLLCRTDEMLTVEDYLKKKTYSYEEILSKNDIELQGYEFTDEDKQKLLHIAIGAFWDKFKG